MRFKEIAEAVGYIPKNKKEANDPRYSMAITQDVGPGQDKKETAKLFPMNKDGKPKPLSKSAAKNSNPNTLFNLGLAESVLVKLERDKRNDIYVLHMVDNKDKHRVELRGEKGYESGNYNQHDRLHQVLDGLGKAVDLGALFAGETVSVNPHHPDGEQAINVAKAVMTNETKGPCPVTGEAVCKCGDKKLTEALDNPYPFHLQGPDSSHNFAATAETPNGVLRMDFEAVDYDDFGIDFAVGKSMGKTEAGDEFRVFATVVAMIKQWISVVGIQHVESFDFGANKGEHANDGRARLYARIAKKLADQLGWKLEQSTTANRDTEFFKLTNPDPVPRDDSHWDNLEDNPDLQDHSELQENFADGKKKGKSRPGRVKKSGASCKGSVTDLRKRAKKYSGERGRMYQWCLNMKQGKKRKNK